MSTSDVLVGLVVGALGPLIGGLVAARVWHSYAVPPPSGEPDGPPAWSVECWTRVAAGDHPPLSGRWRIGRAVVSRGQVELRLFRWGVRFLPGPPFVVDVDSVGRGGVRSEGWRLGLWTTVAHRRVPVMTTTGARLHLGVPAKDVEVVLDALQGRALRAPEPLAASGTSADLHPLDGPLVVEAPPRPTGHWSRLLRRRPHVVGQRAHVLGRATPGYAGQVLRADDVDAQLALCLDDVRRQLEQARMSLADVSHVSVRTLDFAAARPRADVLGGWLSQAGARATTRTLAVHRLLDQPDGAAIVELEVDALRYAWSTGETAQPHERTPPVPEHLRAAVRAELSALVRGERPDHDGIVEVVDDEPGVLIDPPEAMWEHPWCEVSRSEDGGWHVAVPLWTTTDAPSELTALVDVDPSGNATLTDVLW